MIAAATAERHLALVDPVTDGRWNAFVESHPLGTVFHRAEWAHVLVDSYHYEPRYHTIETEQGEIQAAWPAMFVNSGLSGRRLASLPFSDTCVPLIRTGEESRTLFGAMLADAKSLRAKRIECRGWPEGVTPPEALVPVRGYVQHVIDLRRGIESVSSLLAKNARRSLERARKHGVTVRRAETSADLQTFIQLNVGLRRSHGMLPQPRRFFEAIYRHCIQSGLGYILLAERDRVPLAGLLLLRHNDVTLDKYAVNDSALREYRGSHSVMWGAIEMEVERGTAWYNMGRSDASATSLHRFKEQWGALAGDASYYYYPNAGGQNTEDPKGLKKAGLAAFARFAPTPLFTAAGTVVYRHLG